MNAFHYMFRRPVKTLLGILLASLACVLLCLCMGQYYSSLKTQEKLDSEYTTIALPTNKYKIQELLDENGNVIGMIHSSHQPDDISSLLSELPSTYPDIVKTVAQNRLISAYCDGIDPLNYAEQAPIASAADGMSTPETAPYTYAILSVQVNQVGAVGPYFDENPDDYGVAAEVEGTIIDAYALQEGFSSPEGRTLRMLVRTESEEAFAGLGIEVGKTYLVFGIDYTDQDRSLRHLIANGDQSVYRQISWDKVEYLSDEDRLAVNRDNHLFGIEEDNVAIYKDTIDGKFFGLYLCESQLKMINSSTLTVGSNPSVLRGRLSQEEITLYYSTGKQNMSQEEYNRLYQQGSIMEISPDVPVDLSALDEAWRASYEALEINNHSLPIIGTDNIKYITQFSTQDAILSSGRGFSEPECQSGAPVCIISETLAVKNGLDIGDRISIQYYDTDYYLPRQIIFKTANPSAAYFSSAASFNCESVEYEIIGLYRQKQEWSGDEYSFTPNTIFVPNSSIVGNPTTSDSGIFCSYILENGKAAYLEEELTSLGYEGLMAYYDQGYSDIAENLEAYHSTALWVLFIGVIGWLIFIFLFVLFFPHQQRNDAERMWTLGAPRKKIMEHLLQTNLCIALPGTLVGTVVSACSIKIVLQRIVEFTNISLELPVPIGFCFIVGFAQLLCVASAIYIAARTSVRAFYKN